MKTLIRNTVQLLIGKNQRRPSDVFSSELHSNANHGSEKICTIEKYQLTSYYRFSYKNPVPKETFNIGEWD